MNYPQAIAYLYRLTDYEKTRLERYTPEVLDLSRVERLLDSVGNPQDRFPAMHIAGTKGKGSTAAMVESCLRAAGLRTGLYTSPHLHTFRERVQVDRHMISRQEVVALVEEIRPLVDRVPELTTFEAITTIGFLAFARADVDVAVVEVGLGGRLDATNVLTPEVAIITTLSLDHTYLLGDTLAQIAREKAGIIKPGVPVVTASQEAEAIETLRSISEQRGAPLVEIGRHWRYEPGSTDLDGQSFTIQGPQQDGSRLDGEYRIPLLGRHQLENCACAIAALEIVRRKGLPVSAAAVREGLSTVRWPGRLEVLRKEPPVVVDCAHNPHSARVLRQALEELFPGRRWVLVFGASADKDVPGMLDTLLPLADYVIVTRSSHPRAAAPSELADAVASAGAGAEISVNVPKAVQRGLEKTGTEDGLLITGSIFVVADAQEDWAQRTGGPPPDNDDEARNPALGRGSQERAQTDQDPHHNDERA